MGLDTSHDCWHGAYSAFNRWRHHVAAAAGYYVWDVKYGDGTTYECIMLEWHRYQNGQLMGEWNETPHDWGTAAPSLWSGRNGSFIG